MYKRFAALIVVSLITFVGLPLAAASAEVSFHQSGAASSRTRPIKQVNLHKQYLAQIPKQKSEPKTEFAAQGHTETTGASGTAPMTYHGGPVQHSPKLYLLLWGPNWSGTGGDTAYLQNLIGGLGVQPQDDWSASMSQYTDSTGHPTFNGSVYQGTFQDTTTPPFGVDQTQLGAEADAFFTANGLTDKTNTQIVVATQDGTCPSGFYSGACGLTGTYCAWHSYTSSNTVPYTNLPYLAGAGSGCGEGFVNSPGTYDGFSIVEGHEYGETVTDPKLDAWYDTDSSGENGDKCAWTGLANVALSTGAFAMQPLWSNSISGCAMHSTSITVPGPPTGVAGAAVSSTSASLTWAPPASDGGSAVTGYKVSRDAGTAGGTAWSGTVAATARSQTFTNLTAGSTYVLSVAAINSQGTGPATSVTVTVGAMPGAPTSVAGAAVSSTSASLTWAPPTSVGGSAITGYKVSRDAGTAGGTAWSGTVAATARSQTFTNLTAGSTYVLSVAAINSQGTGPATSVTVTVGAVPSAPTSVVGKPVSSTSASLTWAPPTSVGGSAITGYKVSRDGGTAGGTGWSTTVAASARSQSFTNLTAGSMYTLSVAAINSQGTGPVTSVTVVPASVPSAPVIGTATPGVSGGAITATAAWSAPTSTGGSAITGYRIRALRMSSTGTVLATTTSTVQPATTRSLSMTLPQTGNYRFTAEAINAVGSSPQSARSNQVAGR